MLSRTTNHPGPHGAMLSATDLIVSAALRMRLPTGVVAALVAAFLGRARFVAREGVVRIALAFVRFADFRAAGFRFFMVSPSGECDLRAERRGASGPADGQTIAELTSRLG
jgi:hypothetical protein